MLPLLVTVPPETAATPLIVPVLSKVPPVCVSVPTVPAFEPVPALLNAVTVAPLLMVRSPLPLLFMPGNCTAGHIHSTSAGHISCRAAGGQRSP